MDSDKQIKKFEAYLHVLKSKSRQRLVEKKIEEEHRKT